MQISVAQKHIAYKLDARDLLLDAHEHGSYFDLPRAYVENHAAGTYHCISLTAAEIAMALEMQQNCSHQRPGDQQLERLEWSHFLQFSLEVDVVVTVCSQAAAAAAVVAAESNQTLGAGEPTPPTTTKTEMRRPTPGSGHAHRRRQALAVTHRQIA